MVRAPYLCYGPGVATHSNAHDSYAQAGVDYSTIDSGKLRAQRSALSTAEALLPRGAREVAASRGESAYVIDLGDRYLSTVTEALGTKNLVADATRLITGRTHYDSIARDTAATILNDLATLGGHPLSLMAYWGAGSSDWFGDELRMADLVDGWTSACRDARCSWGGGETQVLTDMITPGVVVLGGSAVGMIEDRSHLLLGTHVQPGDAMLFAPATGFHTNALTLARSVASALPQGYATPVPGDPQGRCYGEVLLDPTPLYGPLVEALQRDRVALRYCAHITGHGWRKLMRAPQPITYVVTQLPSVPPIFDFVRDNANVSLQEAYGTFNMGAGFALFVASSDVERARDAAALQGFSLLHAGHVESGPKRVVVEPLGFTFDGDSLQIR